MCANVSTLTTSGSLDDLPIKTAEVELAWQFLKVSLCSIKIEIFLEDRKYCWSMVVVFSEHVRIINLFKDQQVWSVTCSSAQIRHIWLAGVCLGRIIYHIVTLEPVELIVSLACTYLILHMSPSMTESCGKPFFPFVSHMNLSYPKSAYPLSPKMHKVKISICIFKIQREYLDEFF